MITHSDIDIVMNALCGTPMVTTAKFADKIQTALAKEIPQSVVKAGNDRNDWVYCPRCGETLGTNEGIFHGSLFKRIYCYKCGQLIDL